MDFPQEITLDLNSNTAYTTIGAKQGDAFTRTINAHITANGIPWTIPNDVVAMYRVRKPDGMAVWNEAVIKNNTVVITLTEETLAVAGRAYADIVFYTNITKAEILSTVSFIIIIMSSPNIAKEVASSNEFGYIQQVVDDANTTLNESEAWAVGTKQGIPVAAAEFSHEITVGDDFDYTINENTFRNYVGISPGETTTWLLQYESAAKWWLQKGDAEPIGITPSNVGLTVTGTPDANSVITVTVTDNDIQWRNNSKYWADRARISKDSIENLSVAVTDTLDPGADATVSSTEVGMATKTSYSSGYSGIKINATTFGNKVGHEIRDYMFYYNDGWKLDGKSVTLGSYGITKVPSSPDLGDYFIITYNTHRQLNFKIPQGPVGPTGVQNVTASASQLGAGVSPSASASLSGTTLHLDFGIPRAQGEGAVSVDNVPLDSERNVKLDAVRTVTQTLSQTAKNQAIANIGAVPNTRQIAGVSLTKNISLADMGAISTSFKINNVTLGTTGSTSLTPANIGAIPTTFKINGVTLGTGSSTALTAANVGAIPTTFKINGVTLGTGSSTALTPSNIGAVPITRTINTKALDDDITLTASNVGAVPTSRTINGKALSSNLVLSTIFTNKAVKSSLWTTDDVPTAYISAGYAYRAKVAGLTGVTDTMVPSVVFSLADSMSGIYAPIAETTTSGVYIYASSKPTAQITIPTIVCIAE